MKQLLALLLCLLLPLAALAEQPSATVDASPAAIAAPAGNESPEGGATPAGSESPEGGEGATLTAEGCAAIPQTADTYTVQFETVTYAETMDAAREAMTERLACLRELLAEQGASAPAFTQANVRTLKEYSYSKISQTVSASGYAASCDVRASIPAAALDALLSALHQESMADGFDVAPSAQPDPEALNQALTAASAQAAGSAQSLAASLNLRLGALLSAVQTQTAESVTVRLTYEVK